MNKSSFSAHDNKSIFFLKSLEERFQKIIGMDGKQVEVVFSISDYVIPGVLIKVKSDNLCLPTWVGVNGGRIFFIVRLKCDPEKSEKIMKFAFGGASKVGWSFFYQEASEGETSVWGTLENKKSFVKESSVGVLSLTKNGFFWSNDIAMMMQSAFRTIEREEILTSNKDPEPL